jgi:hypothetical protein
MVKDKTRAGRYIVPDIKVLIDDWECDVVNVSASGILLYSEYLVFEGGDDLQFTIIFPTSVRPANIVMNGVVVRGNENEFAIENISPAITWTRLLAKHVRDQGKTSTS